MTGKIDSLDSRVYSQIEEKILNGEYKQGEQITELRVSGELGVSRTPVREAFMMLESNCLIKLIPNKGAVVVGVTNDDLVDIYHIRERLEGLAASLAAERASQEQLKELTDIVELSEFYVKKNDLDKIKGLDSNFHNWIYEASGSRMLEKVLSDLHRTIGIYRKKSLTVPGRLEKSIEEHREILDAIVAKDSSKADKLMSLHVKTALKNIIDNPED